MTGDDSGEWPDPAHEPHDAPAGDLDVSDTDSIEYAGPTDDAAFLPVGEHGAADLVEDDAAAVGDDFGAGEPNDLGEPDTQAWDARGAFPDPDILHESWPEWTTLLGPGGTDPGGSHPSFFDGLELAAEPHQHHDTTAQIRGWIMAAGGDPDEWVKVPADHDLEPADAELGAGPLPSAAGAVELLWSRLGPDLDPPTTDAGELDHRAALDTLSLRATGPEQDVVRAARAAMGRTQ